jgi:hypothetical protein
MTATRRTVPPTGGRPGVPEQDRALTLTEQLLFASERPGAPLVVAVVATTTGHLDPTDLRRAVDVVFARHPMARGALRDPAGAEGWRFHPGLATDPLVELTVAGEDDAWRALERLAMTPFVLTRAPLVRLLLAHRPGGDIIGLVGHHLALDGRSLVRLLTEVAEVYQPSAGGATPGARTHAVGLVGRPRPRAGVRRMAGARISRRVAPSSRFLAPVGPPGAAGIGFVPVAVPAPPRRTLPDGRCPTINDMLLAAAHLASERWNTAQGRRSGTLRVGIAVAARRPSTPPVGDDAAGLPPAPLGAAVGRVTIVSDPARRARPLALLAHVHDQTGPAKAQSPDATPGMSGRIAAALAAAAPPRLRSSVLRLAITLARPALMPTLVATNLGRIPESIVFGAAGPRVVGLHFAATAGMPQGLMICFARVADTVHMTFCHHRELFDTAAAARFAEIFVAALAEVAGPRAVAPGGAAALTAGHSGHGR